MQPKWAWRVPRFLRRTQPTRSAQTSGRAAHRSARKASVQEVRGSYVPAGERVARRSTKPRPASPAQARMIQTKSPPENGAVSLEASGVTATAPDSPEPDEAGALAPLPPLPDAPLVVPLPVAAEPPVPVVAPPDEVVPAVP